MEYNEKHSSQLILPAKLPSNTLKEFTAQEHVKPMYSKKGLVESLLKVIKL